MAASKIAQYGHRGGYGDYDHYSDYSDYGSYGGYGGHGDYGYEPKVSLEFIELFVLVFRIEFF